MVLLKCLVPLGFSLLAVSSFFKTGATYELEKTDTITVYSKGVYNKVVIDSIHLKDSLNEFILSTVKGEINQVGLNNSVVINTGDKTLSKGTQISNKNPKTNTKTKNSNNKCPEINKQLSPDSQYLKINQTGKNNNVKINSR